MQILLPGVDHRVLFHEENQDSGSYIQVINVRSIEVRSSVFRRQDSATVPRLGGQGMKVSSLGAVAIDRAVTCPSLCQSWRQGLKRQASRSDIESVAFYFI